MCEYNKLREDNGFELILDSYGSSNIDFGVTAMQSTNHCGLKSLKLGVLKSQIIMKIVLLFLSVSLQKKTPANIQSGAKGPKF